MKELYFSPQIDPMIFDLIIIIGLFFYMYTTRTFSLLAAAKTTEIALRVQFYLVFLYVGLEPLNIYIPSAY